MEDVFHVPQRPRLEFFDDHVFATARVLCLLDEQCRVGRIQ
jgi:hypothetical protein